MPKLNKKGFTLIEIIVVLIIIAILAAIAVPAMMKYINDAKEKQGLSECRAIYLAAQTVLVKAYAEDADLTKVLDSSTGKFKNGATAGEDQWLAMFNDYLDTGLAAKAASYAKITVSNLKDGVDKVEYTMYNHTYTFENGKITIS